MYQLPPEYPRDPFEAFAFLKSRETLQDEDFRVIALVESYGELFYQILARGLPNDEARGLLARNAAEERRHQEDRDQEADAEERGHAHRMLKALRLRTGEVFELPPIEENPFHALAPAEIPYSDELVGLLQQGEIDGDLSYQKWADGEPNPEIAQLLRQNGAEELRHCERVKQVCALLAA